MEAPQKRRTPDGVNVKKWCRAKKHYAKLADDLQVIQTPDALSKLSDFKCFEHGHIYDFSVLRVGDRICKDCRKAALNAFGLSYSPGASPRRSESLDLTSSSRSHTSRSGFGSSICSCAPIICIFRAWRLASMAVAFAHSSAA